MKKINLTLILVLLTNLLHGQIPCNQNTFWGVGGSPRYIEEFIISSSTITSNGIILNNVPGYSLAFCNSQDNNPFSPTFYSSAYNFPLKYLFYYNGTNWDSININTPFVPDDAGGNGNNLYYHQNGTPPYSCITKWDGISYSVFYNDSTSKFSVADIAVDNDGNVWSLMGHGQSAADSTDSIVVFNPNGQILKSFSIILNTNNAYGCFMLNSVLYLGLGNSNPIHPNTLIPISIINNSAIAGTPIPFPSGANFSDLASCNAGAPLSLNHIFQSSNNFNVSPNPFHSKILLTFQNQKIKQVTFAIKNILGQTVFDEREDILSAAYTRTIDLSELSNGIYLLDVVIDGERTVKKIVKE